MVQSRLVTTLTEDVLAEVSPDEVYLVSDYDPRLRSDGEAAAGPQGFGAEAAILLLLPFVYKFFEKLVERLATRAADEGFDALQEWIREVVGVNETEVLNAVKHELRAAGLDDERASKVAPTVMDVLRRRRTLIAR